MSNPFSTSGGFGIGTASRWPASASHAVAERPTAHQSIVVKVSRPMEPTIELTLPASATVADLKARICSRIGEGPITLLAAGKVLSCPADKLAQIGIKTEQTIHCLRKETPDSAS